MLNCFCRVLRIIPHKGAVVKAKIAGLLPGQKGSCRGAIQLLVKPAGPEEVLRRGVYLGDQLICVART